MGGSFSARSFDLARPGVAPVTVLDCSSTSTETEEHRPKLYAFRYDPASLRTVDGIPATKHHSGITAITIQPQRCYQTVCLENKQLFKLTCQMNASPPHAHICTSYTLQWVNMSRLITDP